MEDRAGNLSANSFSPEGLAPPLPGRCSGSARTGGQSEAGRSADGYHHFQYLSRSITDWEAHNKDHCQLTLQVVKPGLIELVHWLTIGKELCKYAEPQIIGQTARVLYRPRKAL